MSITKQTPLISIVIPTYNRIEETHKALASIEKQTYKNYEIIIVDDHSEIPFKYKDTPFNGLNIIRHPKNLGAAAARNSGIMAAQGEYIAFLDSDDEWHKDKLKEQISYMRQHLDISATTTGYTYLTDEGQSTVIPSKQSDWKKRLCKGSGLAPGSTLMVKSEAIKGTLYDPKLIRLEDVDMLLRLVESYNFDVLQQVLATINRGAPPSSKVVELANLLFINKNRENFYSFGIFFGRYCVGKRYLETSIHFFGENQYKKGWKYLLKTLAMNPFQRAGMYLRIFDYISGLSTHKLLKKVLR